MADAYWGYCQARQPAALLRKRPHHDFDGLGGQELTRYYVRDAARGAPGGMREGGSLGASYERYLGGKQLGGLPIDDPHSMVLRNADLTVAKSQLLGAGGGRTETSLPQEASTTLFVEGLPADCSRREVAHIFRPFIGYEDARLVTKKSRHGGASVLCFVDFVSPARAAIAMDALQGYKLDEQDRDSFCLRLQFARNPGARSGGGHRGRHLITQCDRPARV